MQFSSIFCLFFLIFLQQNVALGIKCWVGSSLDAINITADQQTECGPEFDGCAVSSCAGHVEKQCINSTIGENWRVNKMLDCMRKYGQMVRDNRHEICKVALCNTLSPSNPYKCWVNEREHAMCTWETDGCYVLNEGGILTRGCALKDTCEEGCQDEDSYGCVCRKCPWDGCNKEGIFDPELRTTKRPTTRRPYTRTTPRPYTRQYFSTKSPQFSDDSFWRVFFWCTVAIILLICLSCYKVCKHAGESAENETDSNYGRSENNVNNDKFEANLRPQTRPNAVQPSAPPIYSIAPLQMEGQIQMPSCHHISAARLDSTRGKQMIECAICMADGSKRETVFEPCGHVVACGQCAMKITKCPICQGEIGVIKRIYLS